MYSIKRYPPTAQKSLQAWNAADEHILKYISEENIDTSHTVIINDRFGYLTTHLCQEKPQVRIHYASQKKSIQLNLKENGIKENKEMFQQGEDEIHLPVNLFLIKIPKSLAFFKIILAFINSHCSEDTEVVCAFMTRHYSKGILELAGQYFDSVSQSLAWKKSRVLILKGSKQIPFDSDEHISKISFNDKIYQQYAGVFSASHIDYATQFLLENLKVKDDETEILDLACGNGVIASEVLKEQSDKKLTLIDDSYLAIASAQMNVDEKQEFTCDDTLESLSDNRFDLVVSNPPFHFEHETNIEVALSLFKDVKRILRPQGRFIIVASKHLNFNKHLEKMFKFQNRTENKKFEVLTYKN